MLCQNKKRKPDQQKALKKESFLYVINSQKIHTIYIKKGI